MTATTLTARGPAAPRPVTRFGEVLTDAGTMVARSVRLVSRDVDSMLMAVILPIVILVMFVYVFGGAMDVGVDYLTYVTPGIILLCAGHGAGNTAVQVEQDMSGGMVDRLRSLPMASWTLLLGHVVASLVKNLATTGIVFGIAVAMGFRPTASLGGWLGAVGVLLLFVHAITWTAAFVGVLVRSADAAGGLAMIFMFLPYVSSAFVPVDTMPGWMQGFAQHQPVTPVIETVRGLLVPGTPGAIGGAELTSTAWTAVAWCVGIAAVFGFLAARAYARKGR